MKNLFTVLLIGLLTNLSLTAQSMIEGGISAETGETLTAATITLENENDADLNKSIQLDEDGYFIVEGVADGNYRLVVEKTAFKTITMDNFVFPRDNEQILGLVMESTQPLKNSEITIARNTPKNRISIAYK